MYTIGEFSRISGLSIKTLRFYHEKGILLPARVDSGTGYREYNEHSVEQAACIVALRELDFPVAQIQELLQDFDEDADLVDHLQRRRSEIEQQIQEQRTRRQQIDQILTLAAQRKQTLQTPVDIEIREIPDQLICGIRQSTPYAEMGRSFGQIGRHAWRAIAGRPMCLFFEGEYQDGAAEIEPCFPVSREIQRDTLSSRELAGGPMACLIHQGPYSTIGWSYQRLIEFLHQQGLQTALPSREIYHRGPGMIFRGNPEKYVTELQLPIDASPSREADA